MSSAPPPAIIEKAREDCLRSLPFWEARAQREGVWTKTEERIDGTHYWLIAERCAARPKPVLLDEHYSEQEHFDAKVMGIDRPDRFPRFFTDAIFVGALSAILLRRH